MPSCRIIFSNFEVVNSVGLPRSLPATPEPWRATVETKTIITIAIRTHASLKDPCAVTHRRCFRTAMKKNAGNNQPIARLMHPLHEASALKPQASQIYTQGMLYANRMPKYNTVAIPRQHLVALPRFQTSVEPPSSTRATRSVTTSKPRSSQHSVMRDPLLRAPEPSRANMESMHCTSSCHSRAISGLFAATYWHSKHHRIHQPARC